MTKIDGRTVDHKTLQHLRILAVKRVVEGGEQPSDVAASLGICRTSIYPWLRAFHANGVEALEESVAEGRPCNLSEKQQQQVKRWIIGKDPRQYGFDFGLWSRRIVQDLVRQRMNLEIGVTAVGRMLARMDITPQKPLRRAYERDPVAVKLWLDETYPNLKRRAQKTGAKFFFLDEAGFQSDPPLQRTYGLKGHTPEVVTSGQRQSINVISAVNPRGEFWAATYDGKLNAESFELFLQDFMKNRGHEKVFLVIDGHPAHKAKTVLKYVASLEGQLELHPLPAYSPDLNPDEFVWSHMKRNGVSKRPLRKNEALRDRVEEDLRHIHCNPELVRSFFMAKSVVYATD